jgi:hypothetical protein
MGLIERNDFVSIVEGLTGFIQNERVAAYNEAVDTCLADIKNWIREQNIDPGTHDNIPDLLNDFLGQWPRPEPMS